MVILQNLRFLVVQINLIKIFLCKKYQGEKFLFNLLLTSDVIFTVKIEMLHDTCIIPKYKYLNSELLTAVHV